MIIDKRKGVSSAIHVTKGDMMALVTDLSRLKVSDVAIGMSFATAADKSRIFIFTDSEDHLCFVEAHHSKPNFWHGPNVHLAKRMIDERVEVLVSNKAKTLIGDTYLQRVLEVVGKPLTADHVRM